MSTAMCPACDTLSFVSPHRHKGQFTCPGCGRLLKYTVLEPGAAAEQTELYVGPHEALPVADVTDAPDAPRRRRLQPDTKFVLFLVVGCALAALAGGVVLRHQQGSASPAQVQRSDPYAPDCRIVRDHLRSRYGEGVEVTSWGRRTVVNDAQFGSHAFLSASFRTSKGARTIRANFTIGPEMTVESMTYSD